MSHVWDAMKRHEAEKDKEQEQASAAEPQEEAGASAVETALAKSETDSAKPEAPKAQINAAQGMAPSLNSWATTVVAHHDRGGALTEQYRALRNHLVAHFDGKRFSTLISSAESGEGKTLTCINLGVVMSERTECRTVIVDCDLRKHQMARYLNIRNEPGVADLIRNKVTIDQAVQATPHPGLFVLPAGVAGHLEVGELLGRPELEEVLAELRRRYDYVLIDTPPINRASDAGMLGRSVDGALLVVRMNKTHRESVDRAIRLLHATNNPVIGLVLTHQKFFIPNYLYRYS